jgi:hypothetical protein
MILKLCHSYHMQLSTLRRRDFLDRIPSIVNLLAGRLDTSLELLGKLLGVVQLQANSVLPLLRAASQVLTVEGLQVLQLKSIGVSMMLPLRLCLQICVRLP